MRKLERIFQFKKKNNRPRDAKWDIYWIDFEIFNFITESIKIDIMGLIFVNGKTDYEINGQIKWMVLQLDV